MNRQLIITFGMAALTLAACKKDETQGPSTTGQSFTSALDHSLAESMFDDVLRQSDQAADDNGLRDHMDGCNATITIDTVAMPHTMLIDFGPENCTGTDGHERRGSILVSFTGPYRATGTVITITPQDYYLDDHKLEGSKTVTNLGPGSDGHIKFSISVDGSVTAPDNSWTATHSSERTRTWVAGANTPTPWDDEYLITGTGSGINRHGLAYSATITQPLHIKVGCWQPVSGRVDITPEGLPTRHVDYGNGECDGSFTVTVNGITITVG